MKKTSKELAQEILDSGMTQQEVATLTGTTQATISKLIRGVISDVSYQNGKRLEDLHASQVGKEASHA